MAERMTAGERAATLISELHLCLGEESEIRRATKTIIQAEEDAVATAYGMGLLGDDAVEALGAAQRRDQEGDIEKLKRLQNNVRLLLRQIGEPATCRGCSRPIWWVKHLNGKKAPYTLEGLNHFADCPRAKQFKKGRSDDKPSANCGQGRGRVD